MSAIFALADSIIGRLSFAAKISLLVVLFLVPIGYLGSLQYLDSRSSAHKSLLKSEGLDYLVGIRDVYEKVPQHRGLSQAVLKGNDAARGKLDGVRREVDKRFGQLFDLDKVFGEDLSSSTELERLHQQWTGLRERNVSLTPADSFAQHTALITGLNDFMIHVADTTGLSHDEEIATTYAADVLIAG